MTVRPVTQGARYVPRKGQRAKGKVLLAGVAALVTAAAVAGLGTLAAGYSSQGTSSFNVTTGSVTIGAGTANTLTTAVSALEPGDFSYRVIDLTSSTTLLASVTLSTTDSYSGTQLSTSTVGLQMSVDWCSTSWTQSGSAPAFTYACTGGATSLIASRDVLTSTPLSLSGLNAENSGSALPTTDHLRITLSLPTSSPSTAQSANSTINYTFTGVQLTPPKRAR